MTDDFIHMLLDALQIKTVDFEETRSIINGNFNEERKRVINYKDYDQDLKNW